MEGIPIESLIRFRSVSKPWKSIIDSSKFIADYNNHHSLLFYQPLLTFCSRSYVSIIDDDDHDSFSPNMSAFKLTFIKEHHYLIGYSQGLFGFYDYINSTDDVVVVIWNPSIRKSVEIPAPNVLRWPYKTVFSFGVCNTTDPMIVKIKYIVKHEFETISSIPSQVEVFKLSTRKWISLSDTKCLPRKSHTISEQVVVIKRFIFWIVYDRSPDADGLDNLILSFDLICEIFTDISLPSRLANSDDLDLSKLKESLVVLETISIYECGVWMMIEHGGQNSFIKLYTVRKEILGFRKYGQPIIEIQEGYDKQDLIVYEPGSGHFNDIGISAIKFSDHMGSYMYKGTLLLLDH